MHIVIVDDHALFRRGLAQAMQEFCPDMVITELDSVSSTQNTLQQQHDTFDLILLDHDLPDGTGLELLQEIQKHYPLLPVAMLSANGDPALMRQLLDAGALGYIPKNTTTPILLNAVQLILSGGIYIPPELLHYIERVGDSKKINHKTLTQRQLEVLQCIKQGAPNKEIAYRLNISEATVKGHVTSILHHYNVSSRTKLLAKIQF